MSKPHSGVPPLRGASVQLQPLPKFVTFAATVIS